MKIKLQHLPTHLRFHTKKLMDRTLNPCHGLIQEIGFVNCAYNNPSLIIAGGVLTGVHVLKNKENPGRTAYHIGGTGYYLDEPIIKTIGESVERYAQLLSEVSDYFELRFTTRDELIGRGESVTDLAKLQFFSDEQLARPRFPFGKLKSDSTVSWVQFDSLLEQDKTTWVPAQMVFFGYDVRLKDQEVWFVPGISTGTASHITNAKATLNAMLELIQLDSVIGHWYTDSQAIKINFDERTRYFERFLKRISVPNSIEISFYLLPNPDLLGFAVAAVFVNPENRLPKVAIGLGSDTSLVRAMHKAFLEGMGTLTFARLEIFKSKYDLERVHGTDIDPSRILNLDQNTEYYGHGYNFDLIEKRFLSAKSVNASDLPADIGGSIEEQLAALIKSFKDSNKELYKVDINLPEVKDLGFQVCRVWSPDTLMLCLPSFVPTVHPRFKAYGGVTHEHPHPYP